jgi:hypothetical protein
VSCEEKNITEMDIFSIKYAYDSIINCAAFLDPYRFPTIAHLDKILDF